MTGHLGKLALITILLVFSGAAEIKADTGSVPSPNVSSTNSNPSAVSSSTNSASNTTASTASSTDKDTAAKSTIGSVGSKPTPEDLSGCSNASCAAAVAGVGTNVQAASVQVEPFSGSAGFSIPIAVPPGRAGIQPNLALVYSSSFRQLGNAGVGWTLDVGSIQISTKKGVPQYNDTDIFTMEQAGATQDLVRDPNNPILYHMEVEGAFANIQYDTTYWVITDKKGIKYYYGNYGGATGCVQNDPANPTHIFRWALSRVEDLNGNYLVISYLNDSGQLYPETISYTGNDQSSLLLSTYATVNINYSPTPATIPSTSYISKFLVETAKRINSITVYVGTNLQSTYTLTYHPSAYTSRDLLQSIQQSGSDGTSLPAVTFTYSDTAPKGFQLDNSWDLSNVPNFAQNSDGIWQDLGVRLIDMNGDGYADIVEYSTPWGGSTTNQTYLNTQQKSWSPTSNWTLSMTPIPISTPSAPGFDSYVEINRYTGLSLLDVNGDGYPDLIQNYRDDLYYGGQYYLYSAINNGSNSFVQDSGWDLPQDAMLNYELGSHVYYYTVPGSTAFGSINGAGFPDIAIARSGYFFNNSGYIDNNVYINNEGINNTKGWSLSTTYSTPSGIDFGHGAALVDLTGDGLSDIINIVGGTATVYMNTGSGWQQTNNGYADTLGLGDLTNATTQFIDLLGDGLPDIVIANGSGNHVLINTGNGWVQDDSWAPTGANFSNLGTQFLDANGTGMPDYLISIPGQKQMYTNQGQSADLLIGVNNGIGASTTIQYGSGLNPSYKNTFMPYFIPVVQSMTTTVNAQSYTTTYSYSGGNWDNNYREFDGFKTATITDPDGNYVTTSFLQDHWGKGQAIEQDTYGYDPTNNTYNLYSKTINQWQTDIIVTNSTSNQISKFLYISRTDNYLYDGNSLASPKRTAQEFTYGETPQYGDVTQTINDGQVDPTLGTSIDPNKTTTTVMYVYNTNNWIIGLPAQTITSDTNGNKISQTSYFYDQDTTGSAVPVLGRLTAKVNWLGSTTQADPKTTYTYDAYGNLQTTTDANGNTTTITYDNTVHMLPEKTTNALNQSVTMSYYGIDSVALNNGNGLQGMWGQARSKTDANNQTAYTTYDVFGRPSTSISPLDTVALPTEQKSYDIQPSYMAVTDTARVINGSTATISTVSYYDSLGRLIETKSLGPTAGQYIASGQTVYDNRGLPITKYLPYFTSNDLNTLDTIDTTKPNSQAVYDPMGRVITKLNPDATYSSIAYNQWTTTLTDENGHMQLSMVDAFGRLVQKQEYMGADGRSSYYPSSPYTLYATTSYAYNPQGNLVSVTDDHNNVTTITYDHLGRKIAMNDPDMGHWYYGYDGNGNLIWQKDANGNVISFTYDALNRLTNKTDGISGPIVNLPNLTPQAPTFNVNYNFDLLNQNYGIGRLGSVSYDTGTAGFVYDSLGREISSNKNVAQNNYNVTRQYDALNRLQQVQYPDSSQANYVYNQAGQVASISN